MASKRVGRQHTVRWISTALIVGVTAVWPGSAAASPDPVSNWNSVAVQAFLTAGESAVVSSRTLAITQVAIHDALNAIDSRYERYAFTDNAQVGASVDAATAAAARDAIVGAIAVGAFPGFGTPANQALAVAQVDAAYAAALAVIPDGPSKNDGIAIGQAAAAAILALRSTDGATTLVPYIPGTEPGDWQPTPNPVPFDPPAPADLLPAGLPGWGQVTPFVLRQSAQFEPDGPPRLSGERYARDYNEVKDIGEKNSADSDGRADIHRPLLVRRFAGGVEPDRACRCGITRSRLLGHGASSRAGQPRDGRWLHRGIQDEVRREFLAARDCDPSRRHGRKRCDGRRSVVVDLAQHAGDSRLHIDTQRSRRRRRHGAASVL